MVSTLRLSCCILALFFIAASSLAPHPAQAQKKIARGIAIGVGAAIIGGIIINEMKKSGHHPKPRYRSKPPRHYVNRQRTREIQIALNSLGFEAGPVDGVMGEQTRSAIRSYQHYIGVPVTGRLNNRQLAELKAFSRERIASENVAPYRAPAVQAPSVQSPYSPNSLN